MESRIVAVILMAVGAVYFGYFYHVRTRRFDNSGRPPIPSWPGYVYMDWYLKVSTLLISVAAILTDHPALIQWHNSDALLYTGLALAALSLAVFGWAMSTLDSQYAPAHQSRLPSRIVTDGPYRYIRHPVYTANLLLILGLFVASGSLWLVPNLAILITYYCVTIKVEETAIKEEYPEYVEYAAATGRFLPLLVKRERG